MYKLTHTVQIHVATGSTIPSHQGLGLQPKTLEDTNTQSMANIILEVPVVVVALYILVKKEKNPRTL